MNVEASPPKRSKSWLLDDNQSKNAQVPDLAMQIMNIMEQGIIVWSADGVCELHNTRIYDVLEVSGKELSIGTLMSDFLAFSFERGEFDAETMQVTKHKHQSQLPYAFDRKLPSGRIISTNARPSRGGGYVKTFTDVTEARRVADKLAAAIEEAAKSERTSLEILQNERRRQKETDLLSQLDEWLQSCKTLGELYEIVETFMEKLLPQSQGELLVYSNSRDVLEGVCAWAQSAPIAQMAPDGCWALRRGRSYEYEPDGLCFLCDHVRGQGHSGETPYICVPIIAHGDTVGLLHIALNADTSAHEILNPQVFAIRCGEHISMGIANVKLRDDLHAQSIRDPLTGLYNRRYFMETMRKLIGSNGGAKRRFGLISFDADKFKSFNDNRGHDAGDVVLQAISEKVTEVIPDDAVACRMGGEDFAVIVPDAGLEGAVDLANLLRQQIAQVTVRYVHGVLLRITVSAGVSAYPLHGAAPQSLLKQADEALYVAKSKGRNCVIAAKNSVK